MNKISFLTIATVCILPLSSNADTLQCFTKFYGSRNSKLLISAKLERPLGLKVTSVEIDGRKEVVEQNQIVGRIISSKSKYAGMAKFELGWLPKSDYWGLILIAPAQMTGKFGALLVTSNGQGAENSKVLCRVQ